MLLPMVSYYHTDLEVAVMEMQQSANITWKYIRLADFESNLQ